MVIIGPTFVYHRTLPARIVRTQDEYDRLGEGWTDAPHAAEPVAAAASPDTLPLATAPRRSGGPRR